MQHEDILTQASMPIASPSYPRGPYRFIDREYFIVTYESDRDAIREAVPEPLVPDGANTHRLPPAGCCIYFSKTIESLLFLPSLPFLLPLCTPMETDLSIVPRLQIHNHKTLVESGVILRPRHAPVEPFDDCGVTEALRVVPQISGNDREDVETLFELK